MTSRAIHRRIARQLTLRGWSVLAALAIIIGSILGVAL